MGRTGTSPVSPGASPGARAFSARFQPLDLSDGHSANCECSGRYTPAGEAPAGTGGAPVLPFFSIARILAICLVCTLSTLRGIGANPKEAGTNVIRQIDANTFQIGEVRLETKERRLIIPATVNMVEGPVEYVLVSAIGKLHESIFKTTAEPMHIQTAALLLLKASVPTNRPPLLRVSVELNLAKTFVAEELIENTKPDARLKAGTWRYNGSRLIDGTFIAQRDGSIISIIADPDSLVESGRVSADDDENWRPAKSGLPPVGTPVKLILSFGPAN